MLTIQAENAKKIYDWMQMRGGIIVWENEEIASSHPREMITPLRAENGEFMGAPNWRYKRVRDIEDISEIHVECVREIERYNGACKSYYWGYGLTEASEKKAQAKADKHGSGSGFYYDPSSDKNVVIYVLEKTVSLAEFIESHA